MKTTNKVAMGATGRLVMIPSWRGLLLGAFTALALCPGCGPTFDPASLIETTRVLGARVTAGTDAPSRATPLPGETTSVSWLVSAATTPGPQGWAFALCQPALPGDLTCGSEPYALYQGNDSQPALSVTMPEAGVLGAATSVLLYGRICDGAAPTFDARSGLPGCAAGARGTTAAVSITLGGPDTVNHNPTADRGLTLDGQAWPESDGDGQAGPSPGGADPCATGPFVTAGTKDHLVGLTTAGSDRESYTLPFGDPPVATPQREALQLSPFGTRGKFQNTFAFVDAADPSDAPVAQMKWDAPDAKDVASPMPVAFTFVVRDDRGGTDWTTRSACVNP